MRAGSLVVMRMHELAITESVVESVTQRFSCSRVTRVVLEVGALSGVVPDAIRFCFDVCAQGTPLQGASLDIVPIPARTRCAACQDEFEIVDGIGLCRCGSADLVFLSGRELRIKAVEVA
jgi:hydrogenase nickel incorporation protein HypA/HybF